MLGMRLEVEALSSTLLPHTSRLVPRTHNLTLLAVALLHVFGTASIDAKEKEGAPFDAPSF